MNSVSSLDVNTMCVYLINECIQLEKWGGISFKVNLYLITFFLLGGSVNVLNKFLIIPKLFNSEVNHVQLLECDDSKASGLSLVSRGT